MIAMTREKALLQVLDIIIREQELANSQFNITALAITRNTLELILKRTYPQ